MKEMREKRKKKNRTKQLTTVLAVTVMIGNSLLTPIGVFAEGIEEQNEIETLEGEIGVTVQEELENEESISKDASGTVEEQSEIEILEGEIEVTVQEELENEESISKDDSEAVEEQNEIEALEDEIEVTVQEELENKESISKDASETIKEQTMGSQGEGGKTEEKENKVANYAESIDGVTYSWTYDNGVVVMECSSDEATAANVVAALSGVHDIKDIKELTVEGLTNVVAKSIGVSGSYFAPFSNLSKVSLPSAVTLDNSAFRGVYSLTSIELAVATQIGDNAFRGCSKLSSVEIPLATRVGRTAFYDCSRLISIDLPVVESIGNYAFNNSGVEVITTSDGHQAVVNNALRANNGTIVGIVTDAPELENQTLIEGDSLSLSNPAIINTSLTGVKANISSSWEKGGEEIGTGLTYSVGSVTKNDAGVYQGTVNVMHSNGTEMGSFSTNKVTIEIEKAELVFTNIPKTVSFEEMKISNTTTTSKRSNGWSVAVKDTRATDETWRLTATLSEEFSDETTGRTLTDSLVYVDAGGEERKMELGVPIDVFEHTTTDNEEVSINWEEEQGILLKVNPSSYAGEYKGTITWTLVDAP